MRKSYGYAHAHSTRIRMRRSFRAGWLDNKITTSRGGVISLAQFPLEATDQFTATIIWFHQEAGMTGRSYDLKLLSQWSSASITSIKHRVDSDTQEHLACRQIERNNIVVYNVALGKPLAFDAFKTRNNQAVLYLLTESVKKRWPAA